MNRGQDLTKHIDTKERTGNEVAGISAASTNPQMPSVEVLRSLSEVMTWFGGPKTMGGQRVVMAN